MNVFETIGLSAVKVFLPMIGFVLAGKFVEKFVQRWIRINKG